MRFILALFFLSLIATAIIYALPRTWELDLIANLQSGGSPTTVYLLQFVTDFVDVISLGIPAVLIVAGFIKGNKELRTNAFLVVLSVALAGAVSNGLKRVVKEPRPYEVDARISQWSGGGGYGFPSGHSADAVAAAAAFSLLWPGLSVTMAVFCWAFAIMFSRIYLGVHDPGDVMAGMFLGIGSALAVVKIRETLKRPAPDAPPN